MLHDTAAAQRKLAESRGHHDLMHMIVAKMAYHIPHEAAAFASRAAARKPLPKRSTRRHRPPLSQPR